MHLCSQLAEEFAGKPEETLLRRLGKNMNFSRPKRALETHSYSPNLNYRHINRRAWTGVRLMQAHARGSRRRPLLNWKGPLSSALSYPGR